jgi:hypothetical protein
MAGLWRIDADEPHLDLTSDVERVAVGVTLDSYVVAGRWSHRPGLTLILATAGRHDGERNR